MGQTLHLGDARADGALSLADLCRRYQVRGEMRTDSNIDPLVEHVPNAEVGQVEHAGLMLVVWGGVYAVNSR